MSKKIITICAAILMTASVFAQSPNKMSYQAVIRNNSNTLVTSSAVGMRISILQTSPSGTAVYVETQTPTTNANGLVSIEIGGGTVVSGNFANIDWANGPYFVKTETDPTGGTSYSITGTSQLLSVPYALFAKNTESWIILNDTIYSLKRVGIGTISPDANLEIFGDGLIARNGVLLVQNPVSNSLGGTIVLRNNINTFNTANDQATSIVFDNYIQDPSGAYGGNAFSTGGVAGGSSEIRSRVVPNLNGGTELLFKVYKGFGNGGWTTPFRLTPNGAVNITPTNSAPSSPVKGDIYFDNTLNKLRVYDGTTWQNCW